MRAVRVLGVPDGPHSARAAAVSTQAGFEAPPPGLGELTERELVAWVATGQSNEGIAAELVISPATVGTHVGRAMVKLGARNRAQLVVLAAQNGLTLPWKP